MAYTQNPHVPRVRQSNDNAHAERFNWALTEELLDGVPVGLHAINPALPAYLQRHNEKRHHFGLGPKTPLQTLQECVQAID